MGPERNGVSSVEPRVFFSRHTREQQRKRSYTDLIIEMIQNGLLRAQRKRRSLGERRNIMYGSALTLLFSKATSRHDKRN